MFTIKSFIRNLWAFGLYPKSGFAAFLQKLGRLPLCGYHEERFGNVLQEKLDRKEQNLSVGWAKFGKRVRLKFSGITLIAFSITEEESNVQQFYFYRSAGLLRDYIRHFETLGFRLPVKKGFRVFEPGCNCGGLLFHFADHYSAKIYGADVYEPAITAGQKLDLFKEAELTCADLIQSDFLKKFPDRYFDLVFVSSHFTHILHHDEFDNYINDLKRISPAIICIEIEEIASRASMSSHLKDRGFACTTEGRITYGYFAGEHV